MKNYLVIFGLISSLCFVSSADPTGPLDPICETFNFPEPPCCGASGLAARLHGPIEPVNKTAGEFPWWITVRSFSRGSGAKRCIGALINSQWVLTAAHCVMLTSAKRITVSVNGIRPGILVDKYALHPFYEGKRLKTSGGFDSALLHMVKPVSYSSIRLPICLPLDPTLKDRNFADANVTIVGWGRFNRSRVRAKVQTTVLRQGSSKKSPVTMVRSFTNQGDSGGPMMIQLDDNPKKIKAYYIIANFGYHNGKVSIMMKTLARVEWIKATIQLHEDNNPYSFGRNPI